MALVRPVPSGFMTKMAELEKSGATLWKTIASPCGDHEGWKSCGPSRYSLPLLVSPRSPAPSGPTTQISSF
jgi:hypothetical protein